MTQPTVTLPREVAERAYQIAASTRGDMAHLEALRAALDAPQAAACTSVSLPEERGYVDVDGDWQSRGHSTETLKDYGDRRAAEAKLAERERRKAVWIVSNKSFSVCLATEKQADEMIAASTASMGLHKQRVEVLQPKGAP